MTRGSILATWDDAKQQIVDFSADANGSQSVARYTVKSPTLWEGQRTGTSSKGQKYESRLRLEKHRDKFIWSVTDQKDGDEPLPDITITFSRISPTP